jgi:hypothetical protein
MQSEARDAFDHRKLVQSKAIALDNETDSETTHPLTHQIKRETVQLGRTSCGQAVASGESLVAALRGRSACRPGVARAAFRKMRLPIKFNRFAWHPKRNDRPRCGAKTRAGGTCLVRVELGKARCRFHGGLSTGPKTKAGRARIAEAQRRRWRAYRQRAEPTS